MLLLFGTMFHEQSDQGSVYLAALQGEEAGTVDVAHNLVGFLILVKENSNIF